MDLSPLIENLLTREEVFSEDMNEVWTADSLWAEIRGVLQGEMDEKARLREELDVPGKGGLHPGATVGLSNGNAAVIREVNEEAAEPFVVIDANLSLIHI